MSLKDKQRERKQKKPLFNPYSDMIKLLACPGATLWYRIKVHRISDEVPKRIKGGVLIASNHISFHDPIILFYTFWYRRVSFLATKDIFGTSINRFFFKNMNCIMVDRKDLNMSAVKSVCRRLAHNMAVVIFPEGAINRSEQELLAFKEGTAFMAQRSGKPVLPVYISQRNSIWERTHVVVGEPVDVVELCKKYPRSEGIRQVSKYLYEKENELANFYYTHIKKDGACLGEKA